MTWTRLSDDFIDRPEVLTLSDQAFRLHIHALCWANRALTDGHIPRAALRRIAVDSDADLPSELVAAGLWSEDPAGYTIDWAEQESADAVKDRRSRHADTQRRYQDRKTRHAAGDHSACDPRHCPNRSRETSSDRSVSASLTPPRPDPARPLQGTGAGGVCPHGHAPLEDSPAYCLFGHQIAEQSP